MRLKKFLTISMLAVLATAFTACSSGNETKNDSQTSEKALTIDKDKKEVVMLAEVNGKYFTESTRHGIVYKDGSNGEKAILRGLADEKEFYNALSDIGAKPGNNLTAEDMKAAPDNGNSVEGDKINAFVTWEGNDKEIPFSDIVKSTQQKPMDLRFGGNLESAKKNNTGCVLCLDSCATGIVSDAAYPTGATQNKLVEFYGNDKILPEDGTQIKVIFRLADK